MGGDGSGWQASYQDPLRWKFQNTDKECHIEAVPQAEELENDLCSMKAVMMHRPTHEPQRERSGEYPFSWHLSKRRRLWEIRVQLRFKLPPERQLYFGVELSTFVPVSGLARQAQKVLVSACRNAVGECYHSVGDDPIKTAGEAEPPTFVMPLWAFDQFVVSEPGAEPDLTGDLEGAGMRRSSSGIREYTRAMETVAQSFSTNKIYTFCFWGASQFLDCMQWQVCGGILPGARLDFNKLCGRPPFHIGLYELEQSDTETRHLNSRKRHYFKVEVWSTQQPLPHQGQKQEEQLECLETECMEGYSDEAILALTAAYGGGGGGATDNAERGPDAKAPHSMDLLDLLGESDTGGAQLQQQPADPLGSIDLLGVGVAPPVAAQPKQAENSDLLGLF
jgi:hypothetical protein